MTSRAIRSTFTCATASLLLAATAFAGRASAQAPATAPASAPAPAPAIPVDPSRPPPEPASGDAGAPLTNEEVEAAEAAVLGSPVAVPKPGRADRPAAAPRAAPAAPAAATSHRRRQSDRDSGRDQGEKETAFALELATSGFASGTLQGGLFAGARLPSGMIVGASIDYLSSSFTVSGGTATNNPRQSTSAFRLSAGLRYPLIRTGDGRVDLFAAADAGIVQASNEVPIGSAGDVSNATAFGFSAAAGPGLRLWIHEHVAIAYTGRARLTHLSGAAGAFAQAAGQAGPDLDAESTDFRFEGSFQILGVF
jgi:hypothetical protein